MRLIARLLRWFVGIAAVLLVLAFVAILTIIHTDQFHEFLRVRIVGYLNQNYRGHFSIGKVEGSILGTLTLRDVSLALDDSQVLSVPVLQTDYTLIPLLRSRLSIIVLSAEAPKLQLARAGNGEWNIVSIFTPRNPQPPAQKSSFAIRIDRLALDRGDITIVQSDAKTYRLQDARLEGRLTIDAPGISIDLTQLGARISGPGFPETILQGEVSARDVGNRGGSVGVRQLSLKTQNSALSVNGGITDLGKKSIDATVTIDRLAAADVNAAVPQAGLAQDVSGTLKVAGDSLAALRIEAAIVAGQAHLNAHATADLTAKEPIYSSDAELKSLNLSQLLSAINGRVVPDGVINGTLHASGRGSDIAGISARAVLQDHGVAANGLTVGDLAVTAGFDQRIATIDATVANGKGSARLEGKVDTAGEMSYQLRLAVKQLELNRAASSLRIPPDNLTLDASVDGAGVNPSTMRARALVSIQRSVIGPATIDSGQIDAQISGGVVRIANARIKSQQSTVSVRGEIALTQDQRGKLHYLADVQSLAPWLTLTGHQGAGSVNLVGDASGNLHRLRVSGSAKLAALHYEKYSVNSGRLTYDLDGLPTINAIRGQLTIAFGEVQSAIEIKSIAAQIRLQPGKAGAELAGITLNVHQDATRAGELAADVSYQPRRIGATLTRLSLATDAGKWRLHAPAAIVRENGKLSIRGFRLESNDQLVSLDGVIADRGEQNVSAQVQRFRLSTLSALMPKEPRLEGVLSAQIRLRGSAAAPAITLASTMNNLQVEGVHYQSTSANVDYAANRAALAIALQQDAAHRLDANGVLPLRLSWDRGFQYAIVGDIDLKAKSNGLDLAFLEAFGGGSVTQVAGTLTLELAARGPLQRPQPSGYVALSGAQAFIKPLGIKVENGTARVALAPDEIRLENLSASAKDGRLTGSGAIGLAGTMPQQTNLKIAFDKWPAIDTAEYQATIAGQIGCSGPIDALQVKGRTDVLYGLIRPDLDLLEGGSAKPDHTIKVSTSWEPPPPQPHHEKKKSGSFTMPGFKSTALSLDLVIHRDTWIKTAEGAVELQGKVRIYKPSQGNVVLSGAIDTVRGNLSVAGKNFTISRGQITFTGGQDIDPSLDLAADYTAPGYTITASITGTAKKPALTLSSNPTLTQADILAVLMFGKPANQLSSGEQSGLQQQALSMAGGYAAAQVGQSIAEALGLESLGIDMSQTGAIGFGNYLTQNVYVSATQSTTGTPGRGASITYYLTPHLELNTSASTNSSVGNQIELNWKKEY
jgi:translocation and assembly module TamB